MKRTVLTLWLVLALASNVWRWVYPVQPHANVDQRLLQVSEFIGDTRTGQYKQIAIREYGEPAATTPILLLHGTPVASSAMTGLGQLLGEQYYVISPDMPGYAGSAQPLDDYSSITHARYMADLLDSLNIDAVHVVAYSQGGAAAIAFADFFPQRTRSLALLSTIGVQELELFGSYPLNHAVYAGQLAIWRAVQWLIPHFGTLDDAILGTGYARNLTDTDQRVLRPMLRRIDAPAVIVHGRHDGMVPYAAALEHHRLLPQSELVTLDAGHEPVYASPAMVIPGLTDFLNRVESAIAITRDQATTTRRAVAEKPFDATQREALTGAALLVMLLAIIVASYVSEDIACIAAGLLAAQGVITLPAAILASLIGLFSGDLALFFAGRWLGPPMLSRLVPDDKLTASKHWLAARGAFVIIASRFVPGTRLPTYVAAGALQLPPLTFIAYFGIATLIWTPLLVSLSAVYGAVALDWLEHYATFGIWMLLGSLLALWLLIRIVPPLFTWEGRRRALGRWQRLTRFEFWPSWIFYAPVVIANVCFALRYRSLTVFTLANPGIPLGGLAGESKSHILNALRDSGAVAPFAVIKQGAIQQRVLALDEFVDHYPIVLKPDQGERGRDVEIVRNRDQALDYLQRVVSDVIAQAFVEGEEFGILYCRRPDTAHGQIVSLAHKGKTTIVGDGAQSLKHLILADARAVCMASFFEQQFAHRLHDIPAAGERVHLNAIGTHCRGSLFTDANQYLTPELDAEIDRISKCFDGFYIGRFDLFAADAAALGAGRGLKLVELNGITSEPAHIYHPGASLLSAWRTVIQHWHHAWQIGALLRKNGLRPPGVRAVLRGLRDTTYLNREVKPPQSSIHAEH
ncbi:MAG: alpha/beta fold hydrolase [Pseudomonadota bacterium]